MQSNENAPTSCGLSRGKSSFLIYFGDSLCEKLRSRIDRKRQNAPLVYGKNRRIARAGSRLAGTTRLPSIPVFIGFSLVGGSLYQNQRNARPSNCPAVRRFVTLPPAIPINPQGLIPYQIESMPSRKKTNLPKVLESLTTLCPACGFSITPEKIRRIDSTKIVCPDCGKVFEPQKPVNQSRI